MSAPPLSILADGAELAAAFQFMAAAVQRAALSFQDLQRSFAGLSAALSELPIPRGVRSVLRFWRARAIAEAFEASLGRQAIRAGARVPVGGRRPRTLRLMKKRAAFLGTWPQPVPL